MAELIVGSEATAAGLLTSHRLRTRYVRLYPDVYLREGVPPTAALRGIGAHLWSGRRGVVAGRSAAALHGAKWVDGNRPAQLLWPNRHPPEGIETWSDRFDEDEVELVAGVPVTTPARTALDIARRCRTAKAVAAIDALMQATRLKPADVELLAERYRGARGIRAARGVLELVDGGAQSPRETWLRLLVLRAGYPRPQTQIPVRDEYGQLVAVLDLGWEELKLGLDYDGDHHRNPEQFNRDVRRHDELTARGWIHIRVTSRDTEAVVLRMLADAWSKRT
ncbi:hypothetical protein C731_3823 [Mycolicibacterium hassiacum DSM 44199]|uniref:Uncharacterized protein n=1 Tax=Mycolicibacterium hassiacum (strain DSM 44199 / CIP 105218 / JCM 12690 / 3849) TaxID=1122247 RepID=K5BEJ3_MYCHD|nr:type IV toxin-antitoxin system AbiEi family antitoxin [Mycolicibacterium hassiacum]EKF22331.1 hypothetical protein C731_3823 [Mycolicibacterium hassiacum DSM 44199]MBX5486628.1 hypothetical protein [Mycolicibacterium hassiacum]MDA4087397.1 hypothetical protein [Mycolicibacterium hassiacum DSM 44199]VCT91978.1 hypothetical protein MHAS_03702 [Mycolicibacterium hassiacum DSM 44199]